MPFAFFLKRKKEKERSEKKKKEKKCRRQTKRLGVQPLDASKGWSPVATGEIRSQQINIFNIKSIKLTDHTKESPTIKTIVNPQTETPQTPKRKRKAFTLFDFRHAKPAGNHKSVTPQISKKKEKSFQAFRFSSRKTSGNPQISNPTNSQKKEKNVHVFRFSSHKISGNAQISNPTNSHHTKPT